MIGAYFTLGIGSATVTDQLQERPGHRRRAPSAMAIKNGAAATKEQTKNDRERESYVTSRCGVSRSTSSTNSVTPERSRCA
jgi:hypothetical protein